MLEIGCGRGDFSLWLAQRYPLATITGVDFSDTAVDVALAKVSSPRFKPSLSGRRRREPEFSRAVFDYVISCECLEHVPHPETMAREMARVLKPGGKFILTTENYFNGMLLAWLHSSLKSEPFDSGGSLQPVEHFFLWWRVKKILERRAKSRAHGKQPLPVATLPRTAPSKLCTEDFGSAFLKVLFLPFGRHFTFWGSRA